MSPILNNSQSVFRRVFFLLSAVVFCSCASHEKAASGPEALPDDAQIQYDFAYNFYTNNDLIRALGSTMQGLKISPNSPDLLNLQGLIYFRQNEYEKAEQSFKAALASNDRVVEVYTNLGALYYDQGRYAEAREVINKGIEFPLYLYPERLVNTLGLIDQAEGKIDDARKNFERAIQIQPKFYLAYQNLGKLWLDQKEPKRAAPILAEAVRLCPKCSEPRYHYGLSLLREKDRSKAIEQFRAGFESDPHGYFGQLCQGFLLSPKDKKQ